MALNMDDLIGSMQHGFHAGDRGNDLNEIRESLKLSLAAQGQNPPSSASAFPAQQNAVAGPSYSNHSYNLRRPPQYHYNHQHQQQQQQSSSLDADVAMLSSSIRTSSSSNLGNNSRVTVEGCTSAVQVVGVVRAALVAPASVCPAAATVEDGVLHQHQQIHPSKHRGNFGVARHLQAELERQQQHQQSYSTASPPPQQQPLSPTLSSGSGGAHAVSPPPLLGLHTLQPPASATAAAGGRIDSPRSYVNGFAPAREDSATPTGTSAAGLRGSLSPQLEGVPPTTAGGRGYGQ